MLNTSKSDNNNNSSDYEWEILLTITGWSATGSFQRSGAGVLTRFGEVFNIGSIHYLFVF